MSIRAEWHRIFSLEYVLKVNACYYARMVQIFPQLLATGKQLLLTNLILA